MKNKLREPFPFGDFLKKLRARKGVSLKKVEEGTGISNAYLSQLETGKRRRLPNPTRLKALADYYNVSIQQLLEKAGYYEEGDIQETKEQKIEKAFLHVLSDPAFKYGTQLKDKYDLDAKRFIVEMYEKLTKKMNLIKWLEIGKYMKLGKLRAEIIKEDIIVVKGPSDKIGKYIGERLHKVFPDNLIILLPGEITLEKLDEREMNRAGWVRKNE